MIEGKHIDSKYLDSNYIVKEIGRGQTAISYLTKDNMVYKKFFGNIDYNMLCLKELSYYKNPNIAFPEVLVYSNNELVGYIKQYIDGNTVDNLDKTINIKEFNGSIQDLERNIYGDFFNLMFTDLSGENIIYDDNNKKLTIIDTDFFEPISKNYKYKNPFLENKKWLNNSFYKILHESDDVNEETKKHSSEAYIGLSNASYSLKNIIEELEYQTNKEIITFEDYYNTIKEVKEKRNGKARIRHR